jgi:hypothetical protein
LWCIGADFCANGYMLLLWCCLLMLIELKPQGDQGTLYYRFNHLYLRCLRKEFDLGSETNSATNFTLNSLRGCQPFGWLLLPMYDLLSTHLLQTNDFHPATKSGGCVGIGKFCLVVIYWGFPLCTEWRSGSACDWVWHEVWKSIILENLVGPECCYCHSIQSLAFMEQFVMCWINMVFIPSTFTLNLQFWCVRKLKKDQIRSGCWLLLSSLKEQWNTNEKLGLA